MSLLREGLSFSLPAWAELQRLGIYQNILENLPLPAVVNFLEDITRLGMMWGGTLPEVSTEFWPGSPKEGAQLVKSWLCKHEDLSLMTATPPHTHFRIHVKSNITTPVNPRPGEEET